MPVDLVRVDDRLIHGQVVVGWGQHLALQHIVLVHDEVAASEWEQELYRLGVPAGVTVEFVTAEEATRRLGEWRADPRRTVLLLGDLRTLEVLVEGGAAIAAVNIGGIHHRAGRTQRLRYVYLAPDEEALLRAIAARGISITAQDVPAARPVPLGDLLAAVPS